MLACDVYPSERLPSQHDVKREDVISLARVDGADALNIRAGNVATLVAHIPGEANSPVVTFATSAGFFVITGSREARVRAVLDSTDSRGRLAARITLRPDTSAYAVVSAVVADYRDTVRVPFAK